MPSATWRCLALLLLVWLAIQMVTLPARAAPATLLDDLPKLHNFPTQISKIVVMRVDPWIGRVISVRPDTVSQSFDDEAVVGTESGIRTTAADLYETLGSTADFGPCGERYSYRLFPVAWAVVVYGNNGASLGALYLTEDGHCVAIDGQVHSIDPTLIIFLRRRFSFMNF